MPAGSTTRWGLAAIAGRFAEDDLASILDHLTSSRAAE